MTDRRVEGQIQIEEAKLLPVPFRNFEGREGQYNRKGLRNFCVELDHETAKTMFDDGWNVKFPKPREDEEDFDRNPYLPIEVAYDKGKPPQIVLITNDGKSRTNLTEDEVELLDWIDIKSVDLIANPYNYHIPARGKIPAMSGVKAYLRKMFVVQDEDDLDRKWAHLEITSEKPKREEEAF